MLIKDKKLAHKKYKSTRSEADYERFSELRSRCKILTEQSYKDFIEQSELNIVSDSKNFWKFVNLKQGDTGLPSCMESDGTTIVNDSEIADRFTDEFFKAFSVFTSFNTTFTTCHRVDFNSFQVSAIAVYNNLVNLDTGAGGGADLIPPIFLKSCAESLFIPLYLLFNISLKTCTFPDLWKMSKIVPIHKSGPKTVFSNYRPVSILSVIPKMFEAILTPQFCSAFKQVINEDQHGFCAGKSVESNLFIYSEYLFTSISSGIDVHTIYTDFAKAFDSVNHKLLLHKLNQYQVGPDVLKWLASYLTDRTARVAIRNTLSRSFNITSGVPQGSHLGPLLFLVFINDINESLVSPCLLFADDLKIYRSIRNEDDAAVLQNDLIKIESWCIENDMKLNINKCKAIAFSRKIAPRTPSYQLCGAPLKEVRTVRDLGVIFDSKLSFIAHIDHTVSKASRMLGFIRRNCYEFKNTRALCSLYFGLVRSHLDYCSLIWSPFYNVHIDRIEAVQNKFLKIARFKLCSNSSNFESINIADYLGILSLRTRRDYLSLVFFFKVVNGQSSSASLLRLVEFWVPYYGVRTSRLVSLSSCKSFYHLNCPQNRTARLVNLVHLSVDFFGIQVARFKLDLRRYLLSVKLR